MIDIRAARDIAARNGWLSHTPPAFREKVLGRCVVQSFAAGDTLYMVGDPPGGIYGLISGALGVSVAPGERGPYLIHVAQPGAWLGEAGVVGLPRRIGLSALRACETLHLPLHSFNKILQDDPSAWRFVALLTHGHLETAIAGVDDLMIRNHVQRLVAVLLRLAGCRQARPATEATTHDCHINQEDLAAMANVTRTTAGSILRKLAKAGHIEHGYRRIRILAPDSLRGLLLQDSR